MGAAGGLGVGVLGGVLFGTSWALADTLRAGTLAIEAGPPRRFAGKRHDAILRAGRNHGLFVGLVGGVFYGVGGGLLSAATNGPAVAAAVAVGLVLTGVLFHERLLGIAAAIAGGLTVGRVDPLVFGVVAFFGASIMAGLRGGLGPWACHYWIRWRLARRGLAPRKLPQFLLWCAAPERGWLRVSDAFEFRHRELLDYLAPDAQTPPLASAPTCDPDA